MATGERTTVAPPVRYELHHDQGAYEIHRVEVVGTFEEREAARQHMIATEGERTVRDDGDILAAIAWCRLGGQRIGRPSDDAAFERAKALGLLAQDPCWRATSRGEGALIAAGLLAGKPAPERAVVHILWAASQRYARPQFVAAWTDGFVDMRPEQWRREVAEATDEFDAHDGGPWTFWETADYIDVPAVPGGGAG